LTAIKAPDPRPRHPGAMSEMPLIETGSCRVLSLAAETQFAPNGIVSRTLWRTPHGRMVLFGFDAGQELTEHTSPHHATVQILSGACEWKLGEQIRTLRAGEMVYMPPQLPHAVKALERFSMLLTLVQAGPPAP
jgi:quercetin dioxygenase-like cupin family protein